MLAPMRESTEVAEDYRTMGLSLRRHPLFFLRRALAAEGAVPCADLAASREGRRLTVAGLVLLRQQPGSASGVIFMTIEDETGEANLVVWPDVFARQRRIVLAASLLACTGRVQRDAIAFGLSGVVAFRVVALITWLVELDDFKNTLRVSGNIHERGFAKGQFHNLLQPS